MTQFTTRAKRKANGERDLRKPHMYDLLSVVVHKGEINSGHYISYCRENGQVCFSGAGSRLGESAADGNQWFQFDDSVVTLATERQVLAAQAYLLVYIIRTLA